jgi:multicomponent Na+:H+ antiporter subunit F
MFNINIWLAFAAILLVGMVPCLIVCFREHIFESFIAMQMAQLLTIMVLLLIAKGFGRNIYYDVALSMAILATASGLVYARFLERWI